MIKSFILCIILSVSLSGNAQQVKDTLKADTIPVYSQNSYEKTLIRGMPADEYRSSQGITWTPLAARHGRYAPADLNLGRRNSYKKVEKIIVALSRSQAVKVYVSSLASADGRKMYTIEIGSGSDVTLFTAGVHAREVSNTQFIVKYAAQLVNKYEEGDTAAIGLLSRKKIIILPCVNPGGYEITLFGRRAIHDKTSFAGKQRKKDLPEIKANMRGTDINRNFPSYTASQLWSDQKLNRALKFSPDLNFYAGPWLGSEAETKNAMNFLEKYIPMAHKYIDLHSSGRVIYAGKPHLSDHFNDLSFSLRKLINNITQYTQFGLDQEETGEGTDGTITDYAAEISAGFEYDPSTGRLAPPGNLGSLVRKYNGLRYPVGIVTVETTVVPKYAGMTRKSRIRVQKYEWTAKNLDQMLNEVVTKVIN